MKELEFWFVAGSQTLYGREAIENVNSNVRTIATHLNNSLEIPCTIRPMPCVTDAESIAAVLRRANDSDTCVGVITWMHTFSPSKMWIQGLLSLQKPLLHFHTQYNREIPWDSIDMDYMNLHQSAHGDREHGFISARLRLPRKVICGHWADPTTEQRIGRWMRSAIGVAESKRLKICRFGDNMRYVAVTEGDKVEAEIKFGWSVNSYGVGELVQHMRAVPDSHIDAKLEQYSERYVIATDNLHSVKYQARIEVALQNILTEGEYGAFTNTFEDLYGLEELPGLAVQNLMADGYGFGAEGDWKTAALVRIAKTMGKGLSGGSAFMEDYTYHMEPGAEAVLGAHMLEVDPSIASTRPQVEVHPLGIGDRNPPARLTFQCASGPATLVSLVDMGGRFRMIANDVHAFSPPFNMPKLPVARVMWKPLPNLQCAAECWIMAGGAHHTAMSYSLDADYFRDFCEMVNIEFLHIGENSTSMEFQKELKIHDMLYNR